MTPFSVIDAISSDRSHQPVSWGSFIINFVFWIGIGHAGTLISAVLSYSASSGEPASTGRPRR